MQKKAGAPNPDKKVRNRLRFSFFVDAAGRAGARARAAGQPCAKAAQPPHPAFAQGPAARFTLFHIAQENLVTALRFVNVCFAGNLPWRVHVQNRNTAVDNIHAV